MLIPGYPASRHVLAFCVAILVRESDRQPFASSAGGSTELNADAPRMLARHAAPVLVLCLRFAPLEPSRAVAVLRKLSPAGGWRTPPAEGELVPPHRTEMPLRRVNVFPL